MKLKYKSLNKNNSLIFISVLCFIATVILTLNSLSYFSYKKIFEGGGNLPILEISKYFVYGSDNSLKNITYNGQGEEYIAVNVTTENNNINGLVRARISYWWLSGLSNLTYDDNDNIVKACSVNYDSTVWEEREDGYLYLKNPMAPNSDISVFDGIVFQNLNEDYWGKNITITIIFDICHANNKPRDWRD